MVGWGKRDEWEPPTSDRLSMLQSIKTAHEHFINESTRDAHSYATEKKIAFSQYFVASGANIKYMFYGQTFYYDVSDTHSCDMCVRDPTQN